VWHVRTALPVSFCKGPVSLDEDVRAERGVYKIVQVGLGCNCPVLTARALMMMDMAESGSGPCCTTIVYLLPAQRRALMRKHNRVSP